MNIDKENSLYFPVLVFKSGEMKALVPEEVETYFQYQNGKKKLTIMDNLNLKQVDLKKSFMKAVISFTESDDSIIDGFNYNAFANIYFKLSEDVCGIYCYSINGFDDNVSITKGEIPEEQVVRTEDEFWDVIGKIRDTFAEYYDYQD